MELATHVDSTTPWYRQLWPWLIISGPLIVVIAASYTGWIAYTRQDALVVDDYYTQGNAINQDLRRDTAATKLGLNLNAGYDPVQGRLHGNLLSYGYPVTGKINILLSHATQPEKDKKLEVLLNQQGDFDVALPMLELGRWEVTVDNAERSWRLTGTWKWPEQRTIVFKADTPSAK